MLKKFQTNKGPTNKTSKTKLRKDISSKFKISVLSTKHYSVPWLGHLNTQILHKPFTTSILLKRFF